MRMTLEAIRQNKLRAILTLLGISIGVFSVIGVMTAIRTLETSIESGLNVFGTNTFIINKTPAIQFGPGGRSKYRNRKNIDYQQYELLKERAKLPILVSVVDGTGERAVRYKDKLVKQTVEINGGDENALRTINTFIEDGRSLTQDDIRFSRSVCVLGMDVVDRLFPFEDPLGKVIQIKGLNYNVVGTVQRKGELFGGSQDNFILIPITNYLQKFSDNRTSLGITVEAASAEDYDKTQDEVIGIMRAIRKVSPEKDNDFEVTSNTELIETFSSFTGGVKLFAFAVSVIALLVAGIGIMNIMLVSVTERIKEIGIRKAIGATPKSIILMILQESIFITTISGYIGLIMAMLTLKLIGNNLQEKYFISNPYIDTGHALWATIILIFFGALAGYLPARKAAKIKPIIALRDK